MSNGPQSTNAAGAGNGAATDRDGAATDRAHEIYDQLLTVGKEVAAAYVDAYQRTAAGITEFQDMVAKAGHGQRRPFTSDAGEPLHKARTRAHEIGEKLQEMNKKITLAYLNACELAALAVADCQEELSANTGVELVKTVKTVSDARVEFRREMTKAYVETAREIVG